MTRMIFVRHGQSQGNLDKVFVGSAESPLTELGRKQAAMTARYLADTEIDAVYSSDISRAYETGREIAAVHGLEVIKDPLFREVNGGKWTMMPYEELERMYPDSYGTWINNIGLAVCDGGESFEDVRCRVFGRAEELARGNDGKTVCIATHATAIRSFICTVYGMLGERAKDVPWVGNASVTVAEYDGAWRLTAVNMTAHLGQYHSEFGRGV